MMKKLVGNKLLSLVLFSLTISIIIAYTFSTDFFPKNSNEYIELKKTYKPIITTRDKAIVDAVNASDMQAIREIIESSNDKLKNYTKQKNIIIANDRFLGYTSFKYFLKGTSSALLSFTISIFLLFVIIKHVKGEFVRKYYLVTSFVFVVTSGYWLAWSLLYFSLDPNRGFDFPKSWYYVAIYILPTLVFIASYYLFKYNSSIEIKLKNGIKLLIDYISVDLFDNRINEKEKSEVLIDNLEKYEELTEIIK